jgi:hypothetical protein
MQLILWDLDYRRNKMAWTRYSRLVSLLVIVILLGMVGFGCGHSITVEPTKTSTTPTASTSTTTTTSSTTAFRVSYQAEIQVMFVSNCIVCHSGSSAPQGLSLEGGVSWGNLVNVKSVESPLMRVAPKDPAKSYLMHKLAGTQAQVGGSGEQMPLGKTPLPAAPIEVLTTWISQGALNM